MADFLDSVFGAKPEIAPYQPIDFSQEQLDALEGDLAAWPQIQALGLDFQNSYLQELNQAIPGFSDILKMGGETTKTMQQQAEQELHGQIPQDVQDAVQRSSAFQNLLSGGGGGMASANTARNFGLTSLDLIGQGAQLAGQAGNAAQQWAQLSGAGQASNVMSGMLVTPQQQAQLDMQQNLIKQATQQLQYNVNAAPNPALQAANQWVEQVGGSIVSSLAGGHGGNFATTYNPSSYTGGTSPGAGASAGLGSNWGAPIQATPGYAPQGYSGFGSGNAAFTDYNTTPYQSQIAANPFVDPSQFGGTGSSETDLWQQPGSTFFAGTGGF